MFSRRVCLLSKYIRSFSSNTVERLQNIDLSVDSKAGVATIMMRKSPVNSMSLEFLTELNITIDKLHAENCRGLILSSSVPNIFSAGLEITEMYQPDQARLREFWRTLQEMFIKLYGSQMIAMAAISGHAVAGGCLLALCCDYRAMAHGKYTIGLNETKLGIVAPFWFADAMSNTVGQRETERALQLGKLYSADEALKIGLIDDTFPQEDVHSKVAKEMETWLGIPDAARHLTKLMMRQPTLAKLHARREEDTNTFVKFIMMESIQRSLGMYLESLKRKSKETKDKPSP